MATALLVGFVTLGLAVFGATLVKMFYQTEKR
jgi:hypothetical protein